MARGARLHALLAGALSLAVVATVCGAEVPTGEGGGAPAGQAPTDPSGEVTNGPQTGPVGEAGADVPELLAFEAELVGGGRFRGSDVAGVPVALWFWAPW